MKKNFLIVFFFILITFNCSEDRDDNIEKITVTFNFTHFWEDTSVTNEDFNSFQFTNANGEVISIERLRYLISEITFIKDNSEMISSEQYHLIDVGENENLNIIFEQNLTSGTFDSVRFTFGFSNENNIDGNYLDLNAASWNVPMMLGGGYHYMQFDGEYLDANDTEMPFNYHAIRAVDNPGDNPTFPQDTYFEVDLGQIDIIQDSTIEVQMNIAEWFKNPNTWDLNVLNTVLMPNSAAQILMFENGQNVFNLGSISQ